MGQTCVCSCIESWKDSLTWNCVKITKGSIKNAWTHNWFWELNIVDCLLFYRTPYKGCRVGLYRPFSIFVTAFDPGNQVVTSVWAWTELAWSAMASWPMCMDAYFFFMTTYLTNTNYLEMTYSCAWQAQECSILLQFSVSKINFSYL